jgi:hypothetical protein
LSAIDREELLVSRFDLRRAAPIAIATLAAVSFLFVASASARDLSSSIVDAEARAGAAAAEVEELKGAEAPVADRFEATVKRAAPMKRAVRSANRRVGHIEQTRHARRAAARAEVRRIEATNRKGEEKHDEKVTSAIGFGLAALILGLIVFGWGWFRASAAVAALTRMTLGQSTGLCVGGGFLTAVVGGALTDAGGILAVLGSALIALGVGLAFAFLLARHSAEIQRGRSRPLLRRERWPTRVTQVLAGALAILCLIALGTAVFAPTAKSSDVSTALWARAAGDPLAPALAVAEGRASRLESKAGPVLAVLHHDKADLRHARRAFGQAQARMVGAEKKAASFTRRLVSIETREQRELEAEEQHELKQHEAEERQYEKALVAEEELTAEEAVGSGCDPNYVGECLHEGIGDYDCAEGDGDGPNYVYSPVEVVGSDPFGLDEDGDGIGCQDE